MGRKGRTAWGEERREGGEGSGGRMEGGRDVGKRREREGREERRYSTAQMQGIANAHVKHVCLRMQTRFPPCANTFSMPFHVVFSESDWDIRRQSYEIVKTAA